MLRFPGNRRGLLALLLLTALAGAAIAAPSGAFAKGKKAKKTVKKDSEEEKAFRARLAALKKDEWKLIVVKMSIKDDPNVIAAEPTPMAAGGTVLVASNRQGLYTPETLSPGDIKDVINKHIVDVRKCYKKQLETDPEWSDELILDLAIKKSGRVSEVGIDPRRVRTDVIGVCLMSAVPKWKFPSFTGESEDGVAQDVVSASFPFTLTQK
jgi:hypothetical protein